MKRAILISYLLVSSLFAQAQSYVDGGNTRHRFAQLTLGADFAFLPESGQSLNPSSSSSLATVRNPQNIIPRLSIGGTHFWGHAYFFVNFPLQRLLSNAVEGGSISFSPSVETGIRAYPWRIERNKIRPFLGTAYTTFGWRQRSANGVGVFESQGAFPLQLGLTYQRKSLLFDLGYSRYLNGDFAYAIDRNTFTDVTSPRQYFWLGVSWQLDTTVGVERDYENGTTSRIVNELEADRALSGFSLAIGPSAAFIIGDAPRNELLYPALTTHKGVGVFPELGLGYYHYPWDAHANITYRRNSSTRSAYGWQQEVSRRSIGLEVFKFLGDYHGFVPFIGPVVSAERLELTESDNGQLLTDQSLETVALGITFGWDIRPDDLQPWILRTNLRYTPLPQIGGEGGVSFNQLEFNFIQFVWYPGRAKRIKRAFQ